MAKHPHRLMLVDKKTWRCTLEGCAFFIHIGLAHILPGKSALCWECGEVFTLDEYALRDDMPKCHSCRTKSVDGFNLEDYMAKQTAKRNQLIQEGHEMECESLIGGVCNCASIRDAQFDNQVDEIEVDEPDDESE